MKKNYKGFTMVELLVAMAIIALLIAIAIWGISMAQQSSRNTQRRAAAAEIAAGFSDFYAKFNRQPSYAAFTSTGLCLCNTSTVTNCPPASCYSVELDPIALPSTINVGQNISLKPYVFGSDGGVSNTQWGLGSNNGVTICAGLEGGGYANLSEPENMTCPVSEGRVHIGTPIPIDDGKCVGTGCYE